MIALCLAVSPMAAQSGNELFQQALTKERAEGKLQEAISLYQRILREHAKDRPLAARTLVQLGKAYEGLGERDARAAYERVVREFGDQQSAVNEARDRLVALSPDGRSSGAARVASARMVLRSDVLNGSMVTEDGHYLVFVDSTGNLATQDLRSRQIAQITHSTANWDQFVDRLAASADGQVFAYAWWNGPRNIWELRSIDRRGGSERILVRDDDLSYARPYGFTPDGRSALVEISPEGKPSELALINVQTGARTPLKVVRGADPLNAAVSPDGRFVVYDEVDTASGARDLRILTIGTKTDTVLVHHPAADYGPMWAPGGEGVFFVSTRNGAGAGWYVPVRDGRPTETPTLVRADLGRGSRLGLTRDGMLYYTPSNAARMDVYVAEIDVATGNIVKAPTILEAKTTGSNSAPAWSRDGKFLVYVVGPAAGPSIRLRSMETGAEAEFHVTATRVELTADNRFIIASYLDRNRGMVGLLRVDAKSGAIDTIVQRPSTFAMNNPTSSADSRSIFYNLIEKGRGRIIERDLQTGVERNVDPDGPPTLSMASSPDGRWIAALIEDRTGDRRQLRVRLVPIRPEFGTARELAFLERGGSTLSWTPDGKSIVALSNDGSRKELWLVPVDGSNARQLTPSLGKNVTRAQLSPDGRHVALRIDDYTSELWTVQNFLPASSAASRR
jgi:Tol biopolymer transport system component